MKDKFKVSVILNTKLNFDYIDCICLRLKSNGVIINILSVYRRLGGNVLFFMEKLDEILLQIRISSSDELFVCKNFNVDQLKCNRENKETNLLTLWQWFSLLPIISKHHRLVDSTETYNK